MLLWSRIGENTNCRNTEEYNRAVMDVIAKRIVYSSILLYSCAK